MTRIVPKDHPDLPDHVRDPKGHTVLHTLMHAMGEPWVSIATRSTRDLTREQFEAGVPDEYGPFWLFLHPEPGQGHDDLIIRGPYPTIAESDAEGLRWSLSVHAQNGRTVRA